MLELKRIRHLLKAGWIFREVFDSIALYSPDHLYATPIYKDDSLCYQQYLDTVWLVKYTGVGVSLNWLAGLVNNHYILKGYYRPFLAYTITVCYKIDPFNFNN